MARASKKDREEFVAVLMECCRDMNPIRVAEHARAIMRHAATVGAIALKHCNVGLDERDEAKLERTRAAIVKICDELPGVQAKFGGDPRGYTVKLILPTKRYNTWGGEEDGWGVPNS